MNVQKISEEFEGRPYVALRYFTAVWERLRALQLPVQQVALRMGLDERDLDDTDRFVLADMVDEALDFACQLAGDDAFCLKAGQQMQPMHLGALGHLLLSCSSVSEMVALHAEYGRLVTNAYPIAYEVGPALCRGIGLPWPHGRPFSRHTVEFNLAAWGCLARKLTGLDVGPILVELPYERPFDTEAYEAFFQCELSFGASWLAVTFSPDVLTCRLRHGHPALRGILEPELQRQLAELKLSHRPYHGFLKQLRLVVTQAMEAGSPQLCVVAAKMNCSPRKIQRLLQAQGMTFRELVDDIRRSQVEQHMSDPALSFSEIALLLGFSDQSTFQRAFRRWFGRSPREHRRHLLQTGRLHPSPGRESAGRR